MTTTKKGDLPVLPFSEEDVRGAIAPPSDPEVDAVETATIDAPIQSSAPNLGGPLTPIEARAAVEAVLFVAPTPLSVSQLHEATRLSRADVEAALLDLATLRSEPASGIVLAEVGGGWQLRSSQATAEWVRNYLKVKPQRLTRAALETLAIIAYRQPVTRPEIEDVRGVDCAAVLKALLERSLAKIVGKKEEVGRPILYGTTREFLEFFGLASLAALPTLREFHELSEENLEIVERVVPPSIAELATPNFKERLATDEAAAARALEQLDEGMERADATLAATKIALEPTRDDSAG